tara:strand:+ start:3325 stop:3426 length:102 start_codon:yes stop_codon:yes gene_type:complete
MGGLRGFWAILWANAVPFLIYACVCVGKSITNG